MMAAPRCKAGYKKKDGIITLTDDQASVTWTPLPGTGTPTVSLPIFNITSKPRAISHIGHTHSIADLGGPSLQRSSKDSRQCS